MQAAWLSVLVLLLSACLPQVGLNSLAMGQAGPPGDGDMAGRCKQGLDMVEQNRCSPGRYGAVRVEMVQLELTDFRQRCKDAPSVERVAAIESSCLPLYYEKERGSQADRRAIRARYVNEVSALLLDPAYPPLADRESDLEEKAQHSPRDTTLASQLSEARAKLADLARKYKIDPAHAKALELW